MMRRSPDERGAIMLLALFFAVFAVALLYSVVGTAQALRFRQGMQDAADAAALSGAVMHARGMNLLVLINIVMAALLAILVTIKLVEGLCIIGMAVAALLAWPTFGASLAAIPPLRMIQTEMQSLYNSTKDPVYEALEALHEVADAVKEATPLAADAVVHADLEAYKPPVELGVVLAASEELPVRDDTFEELCGRAGRLPVGIARKLLEPVGGGFLMEALEEPMGAMTESLSDWFCGDGGSGPPTFEHQMGKAVPSLTSACEASSPSGSSPEDATSAECVASRKYQKQARPDEHTGECDEEADCSVHGPYQETVVRARVECDPTKPPSETVYHYQERKGTVPYAWTGVAWLRGEPRYEVPKKRMSKNAPPCGPAPPSSLVAAGYDPVVRTSDDVLEVRPACSTDKPPALAPAPGQVVEVEFTEVRHILGCETTQTVPVELSVAPSGGDGGATRTPKKVRDDVTLGGEDLQVRAIMRGDFAVLAADRIVRLSLWNREGPSDPVPEARRLGQYSVAQAEYFFDGRDGRDEWMWRMSWRARLVRFRAPPDGDGTLADICRSRVGGDECDRMFDLMRRIEHVVLH